MSWQQRAGFIATFFKHSRGDFSPGTTVVAAEGTCCVVPLHLLRPTCKGMFDLGLNPTESEIG